MLYLGVKGVKVVKGVKDNSVAYCILDFWF